MKQIVTIEFECGDCSREAVVDVKRTFGGVPSPFVGDDELPKGWVRRTNYDHYVGWKTGDEWVYLCERCAHV